MVSSDLEDHSADIEIPSFSTAPDFSSNIVEEDNEQAIMKFKRKRWRESGSKVLVGTVLSTWLLECSFPQRLRSRQAEPADFYVVDKEGDLKNVEFGVPYIYDVPLYRRFGANVLGLPENFVLVRSKEKAGAGVDIIDKQAKSEREDTPGLADLGKLWEEIERVTVRLKPHAPWGNEGEQAFIPVASEISGRDAVSGSEYLLVDDSLAVEEEKESYLQRQNSMYEQAVQSDPTDVEAWIAFANFQAKLHPKSKRPGSRKAIMEVQLSIYEKGLETNPKSEKLWLAYLGICQETMEKTRLLTKWDRVLRENPRLPGLWRAYLDFRQSHFLSFSFSECLGVYEACFSSFRTGDMGRYGFRTLFTALG